MVSDLEYLQAQSSFLGKQIAERTANMALFQAVETYNWGSERISESDTSNKRKELREEKSFQLHQRLAAGKPLFFLFSFNCVLAGFAIKSYFILPFPE